MEGLWALRDKTTQIVLPGGTSAWYSQTADEPLTYVTAAVKLPVHSLEDVGAAEVLLALWAETMPSSEAFNRGVKVFTRRHKDWAFLEAIAPSDEHGLAWDVLQEMLTIDPTVEAVANAVTVARERTNEAKSTSSIRADVLRWDTVFAKSPAMFSLPDDDALSSITYTRIARLMEDLVREAPKSLVVIGPIPLKEVEARARAFVMGSAWSCRTHKRAAPPGEEVVSSPGLRLISERASANLCFRLVLPFDRGTQTDVYVLLATALALGGAHFAPLQTRLRDWCGAAYSPSTGIEVLNTCTPLCINVDAQGGQATAISETIKLVVEYFELGSWRDHWRDGVEQLTGIYADAWANARGRGVFITSNIAIGRDPRQISTIPDVLQGLSEESFETTLGEFEAEAFRGVLLGRFDAVEAGHLLRNAGFSVVKAVA